MPDLTSVRVCVIALTCGQHSAVNPPDLSEFFVIGSEGYNVIARGRVYGDSPDEWSPFDDSRTVLDYLQEVGFRATSLSSCLAVPSDTTKLGALTTQVDLYIFDPLFLTLEGQPCQSLVGRLETAIYSGRKHFAVLIPDRLPEHLRQRLKVMCTDKLPMLRAMYLDQGQGEWDVDNEDRFISYLQRVRREMRSLPAPEAIQQARIILLSGGVQVFPMSQAPKLMIGGT